MKKKIVFLTGTRADFGKLKSIILLLQSKPDFETFIFGTGMHLDATYGYTIKELYKAGVVNITEFSNSVNNNCMASAFAKTSEFFTEYVKSIKPDLIVVHGDRLEALACASIGALLNIRVAHIEGGEVSGTIDDSLRHATSKLAHMHFVANEHSKQRLVQLGESANNIFIIGSPDIDIMLSDTLPDLAYVKERYRIPFNSYSILIFHPVTTELEQLDSQLNILNQILTAQNRNYVVIFPNNDTGSEKVIANYKKLPKNKNLRILPSMRFECFLTLMKNAKTIIGNSSAGIREAPVYGVPSVNIGTRQRNRHKNSSIFNCNFNSKEILETLDYLEKSTVKEKELVFGNGDSSKKFLLTLQNENFWETKLQKIFVDARPHGL